MTILVRHLAIFLMKESCRRNDAGYRFDWRKLFFAGAIMTTAGVLLQIFSLPYPLNSFLPSPPVRVVYYQPLNGTIKLSETDDNESSKQFQLLPAIALNNISTPDQSNVTGKRKYVSIGRRKIDNRAKIIPPPPPPALRNIPYSLQV